MAFEHPYGRYSVEGTLNNWFNTNLTANGIPAWMPSARVVYDYPETPLISGYGGHAFSVTHLEPEPVQMYQGRNTFGGSAGQTMEGTMDISCWVSKQQAGGGYAQRLRQMADMVGALMTSAREVVLTNLYTGAQAPSGIGELIRVGEPRGVPVTNPDVRNPDLHRRRILTTYRWIERT